MIFGPFSKVAFRSLCQHPVTVSLGINQFQSRDASARQRHPLARLILRLCRPHPLVHPRSPHANHRWSTPQGRATSTTASHVTYVAREDHT